MLKIFLVEDESIVREGLRDNIPWQQYGYKFVGEASDGEMALPLIQKMRPDVLLTDIKMPFMDGLSLSRIVHQEFPETKIIIISGYDDFEYARQAIALGVEQYLLKPITRANLQKVLTELRAKIESEQEQRKYQEKFQDEVREYEQFSRTNFFVKVFEGRIPVQDIYEEAKVLFRELWDGTPVRLLGIRSSKLVQEDEPEQLSLFDPQFQPDPKREKLNQALAKVREKYGDRIVRKGMS